MVLLVGITLVFSSNKDRTSASFQRQTYDSLSLAEGGIARSLSLLNGNYQALLRLSYDPINPATNKTYLGPNGISGDGDEESTAVDEWSVQSNLPPCFNPTAFTTTLLSGAIGASATHNYDLLAYRYNSASATGTLLVRGRNTENKAVTLLQQTLQIEDRLSSKPENFPGLLAKDIDLGNNDILGAVAGNVICTNTANCSVPINSSNCVSNAPTQAALRNAIGAGANGTVQGQIVVRDLNWPVLPIAPADPASDPNAEAIGSITSTRTLSPPTDSTDPYIYVVTNINLSGSQSLTINTSHRPVYLFVSGNITLSGNASFQHSNSPERFRIYGNPADNNESNDQQFVLNGGASAAHVFIYAPDADAGINGGSSNPDIYGAVWVKTWGLIGSNSNNAEISVPNNMPQLLGNPFSTIVVGNQTTNSKRWERRSQ